MAYFLFDERLTGLALVGMVLTVIGVGLVVTAQGAAARAR
jgi:drug/metabolite transporter (DMT)-like permease